MFRKKEIFIVFFVIFFISILNIPLNLKISLILLAISLYLLKFFYDYLEEKEFEENFPIFLRDFSQYIKIGQPITVAIQSIISNNYGKKLNRIIKTIYLQIKYGIPFDVAIEKISNKINSKSIKESFLIISQLLKRGGDVSGLFESMSDTFYVLNNIKKERLANINVLTFTYYGLFLLSLFLIFSVFSFVSNLSFFTNSEILKAYKNISSIFIIINSIFTGLSIGKISTGKIFSGIIHSIFLLIISIVFILIF